MHAPRRAILAIAVILTVPLVLALGALLVFRSSPSSPSSYSSSALIAHLKECADLVSVRAPVNSVIEVEDSGRFGGARALITATRWLDVGCDLDAAQVIEADTHRQVVVLALPTPKVLSVRLDAQRTRVHDLRRSGLWHLYTSSEIERELVNRAIFAAGDQAIDPDAADSLLTLARERIGARLQRLTSGSGWSVEVQWRE